jgi:hypothetical protein
VRLRPARADRPRRHEPGHLTEGDAADRHSQRRSGEKQFVHEQGLEVFDMRYIDEWGMRHTMQQALAAWTRTRTCM